MQLAAASVSAPSGAPPGAPDQFPPLALAGPGVEYLLQLKALSCDVLLIAAEACDELELHHTFKADVEQAAAAGDLAKRLRAEAPKRHAAPMVRDLSLTDRAILLQVKARAEGRVLNDGEALGLAFQQEEAERRPKRVPGGAAQGGMA